MPSISRKNLNQFILLLGILVPVILSFNMVRANCTGKKMLRSGRISCEEKQIILDEHNRLRQLVALGQIHGQPGAANMMEMLWDDELADVAQKWADSCAEVHDNYRNVRRFAVGQNIARTWTTRPPGPYDSEPNWRRQISGWFNEVQHYHTGYSKTTGHYTQLVWSDSFLIGCGYSFYYDPAKGYTKNYVCNYGPSGNIIGYQPYQSGQPACNNYGMIYSNRYSGLCSRGNYYHLGALCAYG
ncbi:PREDICTED: venom allergen 5-like [Polistes canadensis]|uniref:venom allergen 5-like n=1 Tax=Polistes canadensis TaxID=91411 RepID=UPI000718AE35|nr:PREDICTED: venom allergen 5-like [Polistes canadensis]